MQCRLSEQFAVVKEACRIASQPRNHELPRYEASKALDSFNVTATCLEGYKGRLTFRCPRPC